jgi:hypothetical protein
MEIREPYGFRMKLIKMGCPDLWIAVTGQIPITLVVGHDEDHIGPGYLSRLLLAALKENT